MTDTRRPRALRVALVMGGSVVAERTLDGPRAVTLGGGAGDALPLPRGLVEGDALTLLRPRDGGLELLRHPKMGGAIWRDGRRVAVADLPAGATPLGDSDYGVITLGHVAVFFQRVGGAEGRIGAGWLLDPQLLASVGLSTFLHVAALALLFLAQREAPASPTFDIDPDLVRRFLVAPPAPSEAPVITEAASDETAESDADDAPTPEEHAPVRRAAPAARPAGGSTLVDALRGGAGEGSALAAALAGPDIGALVAGIGPGVRRGGGGDGPRLRGNGPGGPGGPERIRDLRTGPPRLGPIAHAGPRSRRREHEVRLPPPPPTQGPGWLPPGAIQRVVMRNRASILYCYEASLQRRPELRGRVEIAWRIEVDGRVGRARLVRSTLGDPRAEGCMLRQVRHWRFPEPQGGVVDVHYPFLFTS